MKRYPKYKDSGIERFPEVPEGWQVVPCRSIVHELRFKNTKLQSTNYLSLMANIGVMPYEEKGDVGNKMPEDLTKCKIVSKGDFVINSMNYSIGSYGVSAYNGVCSPVYVILRPIEGRVLPTFASRIFECKSFQGNAQSHGNGILAHRCAIGWDILKALYVALPPISEQEKISVFLEAQLSQMDSAIESQERMIELLKERRSAIITQAVTKGLNPNAKMKDSGVQWIGKVPDSWVIKAIKWETSVKRGASPRPIDDEIYFDDEGEYAWVRISDATATRTFLDKTEQRLSSLGSSLSVKLNPNDLFLSIAGTVGKPCIAKIKCCIHDGFVYFPHWKGCVKFLYYIFESGEPYRGLGKMGTQLNLNTDTVASIRIGFPPISEQYSIANYLDNALAKVDSTIDTQERMIELLKERRSAIITQAVTGQIDVR